MPQGAAPPGMGDMCTKSASIRCLSVPWGSKQGQACPPGESELEEVGMGGSNPCPQGVPSLPGRWWTSNKISLEATVKSQSNGHLINETET